MAGAHSGEPRRAVARVGDDVVEDVAEELGPVRRPLLAFVVGCERPEALAGPHQQHRHARLLPTAYGSVSISSSSISPASTPCFHSWC